MLFFHIAKDKLLSKSVQGGGFHKILLYLTAQYYLSWNTSESVAPSIGADLSI
ncbi:hypothetical protein H206_06334 [Candidatus Electrothrix aarhusensis]|uniref:Uncharacterized protein n=1 Tax=Candidatus Electrothrix aarhusensis TaxID=1859131 RepID=A0A3S3QHC3_9BACT|nr:hypothetical protein H206_06334 [Candidatus Electrothrix aarhusensis]